MWDVRCDDEWECVHSFPSHRAAGISPMKNSMMVRWRVRRCVCIDRHDWMAGAEIARDPVKGKRGGKRREVGIRATFRLSVLYPIR